MAKRTLFALIAAVGLVLCMQPAAFAIDYDNNGIDGDSQLGVPGIYLGPLMQSPTIAIFPVASDNFAVTFFPYWWNAGDTGWGFRTVAVNPVTSATITIYLDTNVLSCDTDDFQFLINGIVVGTFSITAADGLGPIVKSFGPFAPIPPNAGQYELRYTVTSTVAPGCGSVAFNLNGVCTVDLLGNPTATENSTWGLIKSLYY